MDLASRRKSRTRSCSTCTAARYPCIAIAFLCGFVLLLGLDGVLLHSFDGGDECFQTPDTPRDVEWFEPRVQPRTDAVMVFHDWYDPMPPREGESFITFEQYLDCLGARLNVDRHARVELPFQESDRNRTFPYLTVMATGELRDVKGFMCNMTVSIRRLMYVQNGALPAADAFFDSVQRAFDFTKRLKVVRFRYNGGFAGAVNTGIRDALTHPIEEVPFYFLSNNDIRFPPGLLELMLPRYHAAVSGDAEVIKSLEVEVATEPNRYTPADRRKPLLRSPGTDTYLVTSRLLPDRIRYSCVECQRRAFSAHYGGLFLSGGAGTACWGLSRLALEVLGLWDENFYPAYYEDTDYRWRQFALGFKDLLPPAGVPEFIHFSGVTLTSAEDANRNRVWAKEEALSSENVLPHAQQRAFFQALGHVLKVMLPKAYAQHKWHGLHSEDVRSPYYRKRDSKGNSLTYLPVDCWVWNVKLRAAVAEATNLTLAHFTAYPRASKDVKFLLFVPRAMRMWLMQRMRLSSELFLPGAYVNGTQLKKLPVSGAS